MLQQNEPDDFVFASGETHSIKKFLELAFGSVGLNWQDHVVKNEKYMRPNDVQLLLGDSTKAREKLGWEPMYTFEGLVREMVAADMKRHRG